MCSFKERQYSQTASVNSFFPLFTSCSVIYCDVLHFFVRKKKNFVVSLFTNLLVEQLFIHI